MIFINTKMETIEPIIEKKKWFRRLGLWATGISSY